MRNCILLSVQPPHLEEVWCLVLLLSQVQVGKLDVLQAQLLDVPLCVLDTGRRVQGCVQQRRGVGWPCMCCVTRTACWLQQPLLTSTILPLLLGCVNSLTACTADRGRALLVLSWAVLLLLRDANMVLETVSGGSEQLEGDWGQHRICCC